MEIGQTYGRLRTGFREEEETAAAIENARRDLLATSAPVSYTHLDVYKRQADSK